MKHMNTIVSVIIAAAILVAAYGVGLLVRHARTPSGQHERAAVMPTESPAAIKARIAQQLPGGSARGGDSKLSAEVEQKNRQMLEKMTDEEKRRFTEEQVRSHFSGAGKGRYRNMSPEEREKMQQKWQRMSEEQKRLLDARTVGSGPAPGVPPQPAAGAGSAPTPQKSAPGGSEPNKAGQE
jgi:hypothetical protein